MVWKKIMTRRGAEKDRNETRESPQFEEKCAEKKPYLNMILWPAWVNIRTTHVRESISKVPVTRSKNTKKNEITDYINKIWQSYSFADVSQLQG